MSFQPPPSHIPNGYPNAAGFGGVPPTGQQQQQQHQHPMPPNSAQFMPPTKPGFNYAPPQPQQLQQQQQQQPQQQYGHQQPAAAFAGPSHQHLVSNGAAAAAAGNGSSNLSSRTASPAQNVTSNMPPFGPPSGATPGYAQHPPHQQQQSQQYQYTSSQPNYVANAAAPPPPTTAVNAAFPQRPASAVGAATGPAVQQLTAGMQNVNLRNYNPAPAAVNGNYAQPQQQQPPQQHHQPPMPPMQQQLPGQPQFNGQSTRPPPPTNNYPPQPQPQQQQQHVQPQQFQSQPQPPPPNNNQPGMPPAPPPTTASAGTAALPKRPAYPQQPPPSTQQYAQQHQPQNHYQQPPAPNAARPPMYTQPPTMPPMPQQQQQPPAAGSFNGQPMSTTAASAPLQYQQHFNSFGQPAQQQQQYGGGAGGTVQHGFNKLWGQENVDLMQQRHVLPTTRVKPPPIEFGNEFFESVNCSPDVIRCTINKIPESNSLLQKSRLPLGIVIHPFRDLSNLPVVQCSVIVRCRSCRTYINPFVTFVDNKKWRCNLCYRVNELPDEFQYDPSSKSYGDVMRRPEVKNSTIEFIAPSEYMLRPPQPAVYLFLLDVSQIAVQSGYLDVLCASLSEHLEKLPGDARTQVGFIAYNSAVHFYSINDDFNQPHEITVVDVDDAFLPCPDNLLINLAACKDLIRDLLQQLPTRFANSYDTNSALGAALQIAFKLMHQAGGRVTVFQTCLPNAGPGALKPRENPNERSSKEIQNLGPATDFYKRLALECSGQQIAVDLFLMNSQYSDLATLSGISKYSGGCMHHFPLFNKTKPVQVELFQRTFERYISRKIGFESVMRVRCTRGLNVHTFHGNFFVRSTDLLSLPNVNPDAGFGMQINYDESLTDTKTVCFQAALLYTSSNGARRIRVHTLCLPVTNSLTDIMHAADQQAIIGLISKMAVDRSLSSSIGDARDAFINASVDVFSAFRLAQNLPGGAGAGQLVAPRNLALLPLYMMALLKHMAFRTGTSTRLDDRVFAMCQLKTLPLDQLIRNIYPEFYALDELFYRAAQAPQVRQNGVVSSDDEQQQEGQQQQKTEEQFVPALLQLSAEKLDTRSVFLLDNGPNIFILVGSNVPVPILESVFGISHVNQIPDTCLTLPEIEGSVENEALHQFVTYQMNDKPFPSTVQIIRDSSPARALFVEQLVDDRSESSLSYYEFLQHLRTLVK